MVNSKIYIQIYKNTSPYYMEQTPLKSNIYECSLSDVQPAPKPTKYMTVSCRLKPLLIDQEKAKIQLHPQMNEITISNPQKSISMSYTFDQVFDDTICQHKFTNHLCIPIIDYLKNGGKSSLIFSYGITNSGKTYSILGTIQQPGILLTLIKMIEKQFPDEVIKIFACQLYKEQFRDLKNRNKFKPQQVNAVITFSDYEGDIITQKNMEELFKKYLQNRSTSANHSNDQSSRSHAIFKITTSKFKIGIVDLAGSQRSDKKSNITHDIKQTVFINQSLLSLKKCIKALEQQSGKNPKQVYVPYRQSKLTQTLVQYFTPQSKINIIVNINQSRHSLQQTLTVIDYTSKTKNIKPNANSDFSLMIKNTGKKIIQMKTVLKFKKQHKTQIKSHQVNSEMKNIIPFESDPIQYPDITQISQKEIIDFVIDQQNQKSLQKRVSNLFNNQQLVMPDPIEEFYYNQLNFRNYLAIDFEIEAENDRRKLSALRKVNLWTTEKKDKRKEEENVHEVYIPIEKKQLCEVGTDISPDILQPQKTTEQKIIIPKKISFDDLTSTSKKRVIQEYEQRRRNHLVDMQTIFSTRRKRRAEEESEQYQNQDNMNMHSNQRQYDDNLLYREHINEENESEQSSFTTPFKRGSHKIKQNQIHVNQIYDAQGQSQKQAELAGKQNLNSNLQNLQLKQSPHNPSLFQSISNVITYPFKSVKKAQQFITRIFSNSKRESQQWQQNRHISNKSSYKQHSFRNMNKKLSIFHNYSQQINPTPLIQLVYSIQTQTDVDVKPSALKKVRFLVSQNKISTEKENGNPQLQQNNKLQYIVEKQGMIETYQVGIQTDQINLKCKSNEIALVIDNRNQERHKSRKYKQKKGRKQNHHAQNDSENNQQANQSVETKTAFKVFSIKKDDHKSLIKKKPAYVSSSKKFVCKNTRGAQRRRNLQGQIMNSKNF